MTALQVRTGTRKESGEVTALRHIDHGVTCDYLRVQAGTYGSATETCGATVWQSEVQDNLSTPAIKGFRDLLRARGWQLGVFPETIGRGELDPLDFCPEHNVNVKPR